MFYFENNFKTTIIQNMKQIHFDVLNGNIYLTGHIELKSNTIRYGKDQKMNRIWRAICNFDKHNAFEDVNCHFL